MWGGGFLLKQKDQMTPTINVTETDRAQRCSPTTNGCRDRKAVPELIWCQRGGFVLWTCWAARRKDQRVKEKTGEGREGGGESVREKQKKGLRGLQTKHLHMREKPAEPPVHNKPVIQYEEKAHPEEESQDSYTLYSLKVTWTHSLKHVKAT